MTEAVYSVGRFQPPTIGHAAMIQALIATGKPAFVFVSSSQSPRDKNPLTSAEKIAFLRKMFPSGVTFVDTATCSPSCGGPIGGREYLVAQGYTTLTLVGGSDREPTFGPEAPLWDYLKEPDYTGPRTPPAFQALRREATDTSGSLATGTMSGTKARKFVVDGDRESFRAAVTLGSVSQTDADALFDLLATRLASRKTKREEVTEPPPSKRMRRGGGDDDIAMIAEDDEPTGGRRRKTRRQRKHRKTRRLTRSTA